MNEKKCIRCRRTKPLSAFRLNKRTGRLTDTCITCLDDQNRRRYGEYQGETVVASFTSWTREQGLAVELAAIPADERYTQPEAALYDRYGLGDWERVDVIGERMMRGRRFLWVQLRGKGCGLDTIVGWVKWVILVDARFVWTASELDIKQEKVTDCEVYV